MKKSRHTNSRLVYSTEKKRPSCPDCGESEDFCKCSGAKQAQSTGDGIVRIRREVKGRRGKTVTTLSGVPLSAGPMADLASDLKRCCGTGGSVKAGVIVIQGDHRQRIKGWLEKKGYAVKLAGG